MQCEYMLVIDTPPTRISSGPAVAGDIRGELRNSERVGKAEILLQNNVSI